MTKARLTFTCTDTPKPDNPLQGVEDHIREFFARGGKPTIVPEGVTAETLKNRREMSELSAKNSLGGQRGGASKYANRQAKVLGKQTYASAKARKPKAGSQIVLGGDDD